MIRPVGVAGVAATGRRVAGDGRFRLAPGAAPGGTHEAAAGMAAEGVAAPGLLALQEWPVDALAGEREQERDRAARLHGEALLKALGEMQRGLLRDEAPDLAGLAGLAGSVPDAADPALRAAVGAVALRARIELARWDRGAATKV